MACRRRMVVRRGSVVLHHLLDPLMHVAAGQHQVLVGGGDLVLVELQLRLRQVEPVLQRAVLRGAGLGELRRRA